MFLKIVTLAEGVSAGLFLAVLWHRKVKVVEKIYHMV